MQFWIRFCFTPFFNLEGFTFASIICYIWVFLIALYSQGSIVFKVIGFVYQYFLLFHFVSSPPPPLCFMSHMYCGRLFSYPCVFFIFLNFIPIFGTGISYKRDAESNLLKKELENKLKMAQYKVYFLFFAVLSISCGFPNMYF